MRFFRGMASLIQNMIAFVVMIVLAVVSFFFTVFVVDFGASLAGYPQNPYTVLSASLLVSAAILAGGISPIGFLSRLGEMEQSRGSASRS